MAVYFATNSAPALLNAFNQTIAKHGQAGGVNTWRHVVHQGKNWYTHTGANWKDKAWFRAEPEANRLAFYVRPVERVTLTRDAYAYYAGHLIETFVRHFPTLFSAGQATAAPVGDDAPF